MSLITAIFYILQRRVCLLPSYSALVNMQLFKWSHVPLIECLFDYRLASFIVSHILLERNIRCDIGL